MRKILAAGVFALATTASAAAASDAFDNAVLCYDKLEAGAYQEALKLCTAALNADTLSPQNVAITANNRGRVYLRLRAFTAAEADFTRAIGNDPTYAHAFNNRGLARMERGDLANARADFDKALALDPTYANALFNRALLRRKQGDKPGAVTDLDNALALKPDFEAARRERKATMATLTTTESASTAEKKAEVKKEAAKKEAKKDKTQRYTLKSFRPLLREIRRRQRSARAVQTALKRQGFYKGRIDGDFGRRSRRALRACLRRGCRL